MERPHEMAVDVIGQDGQRVAEVRAGFQVPGIPPDLDVHELLALPIVLPFANAGVTAYGSYSCEISIDGTHHRTLLSRVAPPPTAPARSGGPS